MNFEMNSLEASQMSYCEEHNEDNRAVCFRESSSVSYEVVTYGHMERMSEERLVKPIYRARLEGTRGRSGPRRY